MCRQTQGIVNAFLGSSSSSAATVAQALHDLNSHAAFETAGRAIFSKLMYPGSAGFSGISVASQSLERRSISTTTLGSPWTVKPIKRHFPAFLAASNASMAPPGAKMVSKSLLGMPDLVKLPEVDVVGLHALEAGFQLSFGAFPSTSSHFVVIKTSLRTEGQDCAVYLF